MTDTRAQLIADYADLGVSCGYIGDIRMAPMRDDRSFRVFTCLSSRPAATACDQSITVFDVPRDHKGVWMDAVTFDTPAVRARLDAMRARLAAGELYRVGR